MIGGLAYFLPSYTSLCFYSQYICSGLLVSEKRGRKEEALPVVRFTREESKFSCQFYEPHLETWVCVWARLCCD